VLSSAFLEKGMSFVIDPTGLQGGLSQRKAEDGFTYFGIKKYLTPKWGS